MPYIRNSKSYELLIYKEFFEYKTFGSTEVSRYQTERLPLP